MPKLDRTVTLGNLLSTATVIVGLSIAYARNEATIEHALTQVNGVQSALTEYKTNERAVNLALETRLRTLETAEARTTVRLENIETLLTRIDTRLERLIRPETP